MDPVTSDTLQTLIVAALNLFTMTSQGRVVDQDLQPEAYEEKRLGAKVLQLAFDGRDIRLYDGKTTEQPPLAQDTASQFVELGHRFATGRETLAVGNTVRMWLARPSAVAAWRPRARWSRGLPPGWRGRGKPRAFSPI